MTRSTPRLVHLATASLVLLGCTGKGDRTAPTPAPTPAPAPAPAPAPQVRLAAGETLATLGDGTHGGANPLRWAAGGRTVLLAVVAKNGAGHLRAYAGDAPLDLTSPVSGDVTYELTPAKDGGSVHFRARELTGRAPGAGALFAFHDAQVVWDAGHARPAIGATWECDESTGKACDGPAWTDDGEDDETQAAASSGGSAEPEITDDPCCCRVPTDDSGHVRFDVISWTACERKTDDGKCVPMSACTRHK